MKPTINGPKFVFQHLPKSAGNSATSLFRNFFGSSAVLHLSESQVSDFSQLDCQDFQVLAGHLSRGQILRLAPNASKITIVRNPADRLFSQYRFEFQLLDPRSMARAAKKLTFDDWLEESKENDLESTYNLQSQLILGLTKDQLQGMSESSAIDALEEVLGEFKVVGLYERLQQSFDLICGLIDQPRYSVATVFNRSKLKGARQEISRSALQKINERNQIDLLLHEEVSRRFSQNYEKMIERLTNVNHTRKRLIDHFDTGKLPNHMLDSISGSGWYEVEHDSMGNPFRWIGGGKVATIVAIPPPAPCYKIRIRVVLTISPEALSAFQIQVNGTEVNLESQFTEAGIVLEGLCLPSKQGERETFFLELLTPVGLDPTVEDDRRLALGIAEVAVIGLWDKHELRSDVD